MTIVVQYLHSFMPKISIDFANDVSVADVCKEMFVFSNETSDSPIGWPINRWLLLPALLRVLLTVHSRSLVEKPKESTWRKVSLL